MQCHPHTRISTLESPFLSERASFLGRSRTVALAMSKSWFPNGGRKLVGGTCPIGIQRLPPLFSQVESLRIYTMTTRERVV